MNPILLALLEKVALPIALNLLKRAGVINGFEAAGIKAGTHVLQAVENIKTYPEYPTDKGFPAPEVILNGGQSG